MYSGNERRSVWRSVDWLTVLIYVLMVLCGWLSICGASYEYDTTGLFAPAGRPGSQLIWIGSAFVISFIILMLDRDIYETFAYPLYGLLLLLLIATVFLAPDIKGSRSWLVLGPIRLQPAEFAKFATALALARLLGSDNFNLFTLRNFSLVLLIILAPMGFILMQKETGSALVFLAFALVLYREGMSGYLLLSAICAVTFFVAVMKFDDTLLGITPAGQLIVSSLTLIIEMFLIAGLRRNDRLTIRILLYGLVAVLILAIIPSLYLPINFAWVLVGVIISSTLLLLIQAIIKLSWKYALIALFALSSVAFMLSVDYVFNDLLEPHQQQRIRVSLGLEDDPGGSGYNVNQSKIAIGSGGFLGKGFLNGTQTKLKYVPEQDTDFIFCTVGEEFGFLGSILVLSLFGIMIVRLIQLAERQDTLFGRVYGYSVASIILFHLVINVGMVLGLTPVIGIPLPFFSYGGSSLWGFTILLFIFLRIDASRKEV